MRGWTREGQVEDGEEVSGGGLLTEQALRDPWCLKKRRQRERMEKRKLEMNHAGARKHGIQWFISVLLLASSDIQNRRWRL